ncbi:ProQ/FinO family protein (plasmid) [Azospirillum sp. HJ39]|uniref:ProQ/FINO family protein n=1 Tax=Azospirillum sp. HJ39 TaxID=3159496 RepID=UPI003558FE1A
MSKHAPAQVRSDRYALAKAFPNAFEPPRSGRPKQPLKIGIFQDLAARGVADKDGRPLSRTRIGRAFGDYVRGYRYHLSGSAGGQRIDLDGNPVGEVTEKERSWHAGIVAKMDRDRERGQALKAERRRVKASSILQAAE